MTQDQIHAAFARGELSPVQAAALTLDRERAEGQRARRSRALGLLFAVGIAVGWVLHGCTPIPLPPLPPPPCAPSDINCFGAHAPDGGTRG